MRYDCLTSTWKRIRLRLTLILSHNVTLKEELDKSFLFHVNKIHFWVWSYEQTYFRLKIFIQTYLLASSHPRNKLIYDTIHHWTLRKYVLKIVGGMSVKMEVHSISADDIGENFLVRMPEKILLHLIQICNDISGEILRHVCIEIDGITTKLGAAIGVQLGDKLEWILWNCSLGKRPTSVLWIMA